MIMMEIGLHRSNAQREISAYKEENHPIPTHPGDYTSRGFSKRLLYENKVGEETILMCLQRWCEDFKFSSEEVKGFIEKENKE